MEKATAIPGRKQREYVGDLMDIFKWVDEKE
jgi:hypothetical protein